MEIRKNDLDWHAFGYFTLKLEPLLVSSSERLLRQIATRPDVAILPKTKPALDLNHKPFQEFPVLTLDELVQQLEAVGQGIDVLTIDGVPHSVCGKPLSNILVQTDAVKHLPGDLLAIYQYCEGCKVAVRVL
jgi:hypothetical protein